MIASAASPLEIDYPSSDGEPLAETQQHVLAILTTLVLLRLYLQDRPAVVFADQFFYYIEGEPKSRVVPDVMVVFDIPKRLYPHYKLWEGRQIPAVIIEVTSRGTKDVDLGFKKALYEELGVLEYWLFDPYGEWIGEQLRGHGLNEAGIYQPIVDGRSQVLGLRLQPEEYLIGFYRLDTGEKLLTPEELYQAAQDANQRAEEERARAERLAGRLRALGLEED